jgi:outer membrane immunogenic protein
LLGGHWLARAEYRYADYGHSSFTTARTGIDRDVNPTVDVFDVALRTHTVNFGLAYKFE